MSFDFRESAEGTDEPRRLREGRRRPYTPPHLEALGDLRDLTLGGSPGTGDSGDPVNFSPLGGGPNPPPASGTG